MRCPYCRNFLGYASKNDEGKRLRCGNDSLHIPGLRTQKKNAFATGGCWNVTTVTPKDIQKDQELQARREERYIEAIRNFPASIAGIATT